MDTKYMLPEFTPSRNKWIINGGIVALFLYAGFWLLNIHVARNGESLLLLFFLLSLFTPQSRAILLKEPILYILAAWVIFQIGVYQWAAAHYPELRSDHISEASTITNVFMFVVTAWWFGGNDNRIASVIALGSIGYIIGATFQDGGLIDEWGKIQSGERPTFGYHNWEHASVYSAFAIIALLSLRKRIIGLAPKKYRLATAISLYVIVCYASFAVIITQTRATWLGLSLAALTALCLYLYYWLKSLNRNNEARPRLFNIKKSLITAFSAASIIGALYATDTMQLINNRLQDERGVINKVLEGDTENLRLSSIGIRIKIWSMGIEWFKQRPVTGWGPQSRKALFYEGDQPVWMKKLIRHLHNSYLELLVSYGIIGLLLFVGLFFYVWVCAWQAWRHKIMPDDIMSLGLLWSVYWIIVNGFESYVIYSSTGNYLDAIVAGILYSYHLRRKQAMNCTSTHSKKPV